MKEQESPCKRYMLAGLVKHKVRHSDLSLLTKKAIYEKLVNINDLELSRLFIDDGTSVISIDDILLFFKLEKKS